MCCQRAPVWSLFFSFKLCWLSSTFKYVFCKTHDLENKMNLKDKLAREDQLSSWRLASLLAFNAFLIPTLAITTGILNEKPWLIPLMGALITLCFLWTMVEGLRQKYKIHLMWEKENKWSDSPMGKQRSAFMFYLYNMFGPFLFSPTILLFFWGYILILKQTCYPITN